MLSRAQEMSLFRRDSVDGPVLLALTVRCLCLWQPLYGFLEEGFLNDAALKRRGPGSLYTASGPVQVGSEILVYLDIVLLDLPLKPEVRLRGRILGSRASALDSDSPATVDRVQPRAHSLARCREQRQADGPFHRPQGTAADSGQAAVVETADHHRSQSSHTALSLSRRRS